MKPLLKTPKAFKMAFQPVTSCAQEKSESREIESVLEQGTAGADIEEDHTACPWCGIYSDWRTDSTASFQSFSIIAGLFILGACFGFMFAI